MRRLATLVAVLSCASVAAPAQAASELFVQSAARATTAPAGASERFTLTLQGTPKTVLAFDDRPQRRSRQIPLASFLRLWSAGATFRAVPPNAVLAGTVNGRRSQTVVELIGATRVRNGARYAIRARTGRPPRRLSRVSLFVDPAPSPSQGAQGDIVVRAGQQLTLSFPSTSTGELDYSSLTIEPGGSLLVPAGCVVFFTVPAASVEGMIEASTPRLGFVADKPARNGQYALAPPLAAQTVIAPAATLTVSPLTINGVCVS